MLHGFSVLSFPTRETHLTSDMCSKYGGQSYVLRRIYVCCSRRHIEVNPVISNANTVKFLFHSSLRASSLESACLQVSSTRIFPQFLINVFACVHSSWAAIHSVNIIYKTVIPLSDRRCSHTVFCRHISLNARC